ncbi:DUF481 domain-containing protein [Ectothiorhodospiraceae bacterium 2226]|nr:DUF481 domain-containing protein [Ectothiorhodospiraceae bacterium 2226]
MFRRICCLALGAGLAAPTLAQEASTWDVGGEAELGVVATTGQTQSRSLNSALRADARRDDWTHTARYKGVRVSSEEAVSTERYMGELRSAYQFTPRTGAFLNVRYDRDRFGAYRYRVSETAGLTWNVVRRTDTTLQLEAGAGARQSALRTGGTEREAILRGAARFMHRFNPSAVFNQDLIVEAGEDNTVTESVSALRFDVIGNLATKLSYTVRYTSPVPEGFASTDTISAVTLVYGF